MGPGTWERRGPAHGPTWPAHAAAAVALAFAAVSFFWGLGGTAGLSTLGGTIEAMARDRDPLAVVAVWVTGVLKVLGGVLALALVRPFGARLPRRPLLVLAWAGGVLLTAYGVAQVSSVAAVLLGAVTPSEPLERSALWWRLLLWEPWFLVWGVLLALAARTAGRRAAPAPAG